jgi:hypothetical protein
MKHVRAAYSENFCRSRGFMHSIKDINEQVIVKCQHETKQASPPDFMFHFCRICVTSGDD